MNDIAIALKIKKFLYEKYWFIEDDYDVDGKNSLLQIHEAFMAAFNLKEKSPEVIASKMHEVLAKYDWATGLEDYCSKAEKERAIQELHGAFLVGLLVMENEDPSIVE